MLTRGFVLPPINTITEKLPLEMRNQTIQLPFSFPFPTQTSAKIGTFPMPQIAFPTPTILVGQKGIQEKQQQIAQQQTTLGKKCKFTPEEDQRLMSLVMKYGTRDWLYISQKMMSRNPRQCRERWNNYLNPNLTAEPWTIEEDR